MAGEMDPIPLDWFGKPAPALVEFSVALNSEHLMLVGRCNQRASADPSLSVGQFFEGLWEKDVAELFVRRPGSDRYVEFNLSPYGAWWACRLDGHRNRVGDFAEVAGARCLSEVSSDHWCAGMEIPLKPVEDHVGPILQAEANVTFVLYTPEPAYLTFADLGGGTPDYHRYEKLLPLEQLGR